MVKFAPVPLRVPTAGDLLVATPRWPDRNFERTVVFVIEHQRAGTLGVVINRVTDVPCASAVPRWSTHFSDGAAVGIGGPVRPRGLLALGTMPEPSAAEPEPSFDSDVRLSDAGGAWRAVSGGVGLVDLAADPSDLDAAVAEVRVYRGHAGWAPGQLQRELKAGCWWVFDSAAGDLTAEATTLWYDVLARQPSPTRLLANYPDNPSRN